MPTFDETIHDVTTAPNSAALFAQASDGEPQYGPVRVGACCGPRQPSVTGLEDVKYEQHQ